MKNRKPKLTATFSAWGYTEDGKKFVIPPRPAKVTYRKLNSQSAKKSADRKRAA
jgi:hypothetical protein